MNNKYEERLGTERMLPLVFKMALPAVAAQFVNLLYSIVDRIYIGHIPGIGTDALAGVGVTTSLIILISSFSANCRRRWCSAGCHCTRTGRPCTSRKDIGKRVCFADIVYFADFCHRIYFYGTYSPLYRSFGKHLGICG